MELLGVAVRDFDRAVAVFTELFGLEFRIHHAGTDCPVTNTIDVPDDSAPGFSIELAG